MPLNTNAQLSLINKLISDTYSKRGRINLIRPEAERDMLTKKYSINEFLDQPIDLEVLRKIQFYNQWSCIYENSTESLFKPREPHRTQF